MISSISATHRICLLLYILALISFNLIFYHIILCNFLMYSNPSIRMLTSLRVENCVCVCVCVYIQVCVFHLFNRLLPIWWELNIVETKLIGLIMGMEFWPRLQSIQFSHLVISDSLWPHGLQNASIPCPSPTPRAYSNSCLSSRWCYPIISSSVILFSSQLQSFPARLKARLMEVFLKQLNLNDPLIKIIKTTIFYFLD